MNMNEMPFWEKPREKMMKYGADSLSTAEVLAIILRTGTRKKSAVELAVELLSLDKRGLRYLAECSPEELKKIHGLGNAKICELMAAMELGRRLACLPAEERPQIKCSDDIAELFMERLRYKKKEYFKCLLINARGEIIEESDISIGDLTSSASHPREVFTNAVRRSAGSIAFVHNHPSGDPEPSPSDIQQTKRLCEVGQLLGIPVIDHIIVGDGKYVSMKHLGLMD
ncbi:MAG: DNA repair protein RadC [Eubacteriales bacterium]|nr:DNA repair protein RadC [Eubacteriales bacterium]